MLRKVKKIYRRGIAGIMLFTAETILTVILFLMSLIAFLAVAKYVFWDKKHEFDLAAFTFLESFIKDDVTNAMWLLSIIGNYQVMIAANLLLICYFLFIRKHRWYSIKIPAISLSSVLLMSILKNLFNRPRPLIPLLEPARGLSFPSGHAMMSATFFGLIIYFIYRKQIKPSIKILLISLLVIFILSIGLSRIYLRVHYASDVIAGFCMGVIWLTIAIRVLNRIELYSKKEINTSIEQTPEVTD
ncbi:phosphatase PAP2 family protein [Pedobacter sp. P351]|uniref:phosphatase PAP2 family protein n=1 Tax=Pedobacter superstes TaxID=3133441 RepID=UPI00309E14D4